MARDNFLPDFCGLPMVLSVIVTAQLLAVIFALYVADSPQGVMDELGFNSLFLLWHGLSSALVLCLFRPLWRRLSPVPAGLLAWLALQGMALLVCHLAVTWLDHLFPQLADPWFYAKTLGITAIVGALMLRYLYMQQRWLEQVEAEAQARLQAMQARIRPHFLFNSMNTLAELTRSDPEKAERVVEDLADLYRVALSEAGTTSTLGDELALAEGYLRIEKIRLGERLRVDWALDEFPQGLEMPGLVLQPLLENAVYHGIEPSPEGGRIDVSVRAERGHIKIALRNTLPEAVGRRRQGNRMAQENTRERLLAFFDGDASLDAGERDGHYWVELRIPK
jgi:two-component system sensor histidine kinase AlgZ